MLIPVTLNAISLTQDIFTDMYIMMYIISAAQLISTKHNKNIRKHNKTNHFFYHKDPSTPFAELFAQSALFAKRALLTPDVAGVSVFT